MLNVLQSKIGIESSHCVLCSRKLLASCRYVSWRELFDTNHITCAEAFAQKPPSTIVFLSAYCASSKGVSGCYDITALDLALVCTYM